MLCPKCNEDTKAANKGIIRHRTCRFCKYEFITIEVIYEPMSTKEKLEKFMADRKRHIKTSVLAAYFMVASSTVNRLMGELENEGKVTRTREAGGRNVWGWNHSMAVPKPPAQVQRSSQPAPVVGRPTPPTPSYPHVRGYDD